MTTMTKRKASHSIEKAPEGQKATDVDSWLDQFALPV